jgi:hypothetical protein
VIRFSALLTVAAMAMLVAGVSSASLGLVYASIAVSILAAITLCAGVLLRRRELFRAGAQDRQPGWAAAGAAAVPPATAHGAATGPARAADPADDQARARPNGTSDDRRGNGERKGDLAERLRTAAAGAAGSGSGRWPGAIAAKGAPAPGRRGGEHAAGHAAGRGRPPRPAPRAEPAGPAPRAEPAGPAPHAPAAREAGREDRARAESERPGLDRDDATAIPWGDRQPARGERWPQGRAGSERPGSGRGRERDRPGRESDRDRAGRGRDRPGIAPVEREQAEAGPATAAGGGRDQAARGRDQDRARAGRETAAWGDPDRDQATGQQAEAFRLPAPDERAGRSQRAAVRRESPDERATGDEFWDRVSEELTGGGSQDPVRPAWPATAGPRAMGAGSVARPGAAGTGGDEPEPGRPSPGSRQAGPAPWDRGETSHPPGEPDEGPRGDETPAEGGEPPWDRMVPRYVDDLARPRQRREPPGTGRDRGAREPPAETGAPAAGPAGQDAVSMWSAWSTARSARTGSQPADAGLEPGRPGGGAESAGAAVGGAESGRADVAKAAGRAESRAAESEAAPGKAAIIRPGGRPAEDDKAPGSPPPSGEPGGRAAGDGGRRGEEPADARHGADTAESKLARSESGGEQPAEARFAGRDTVDTANPGSLAETDETAVGQTAADETALEGGGPHQDEPEASYYEIEQSKTRKAGAGAEEDGTGEAGPARAGAAGAAGSDAGASKSAGGIAGAEDDGAAGAESADRAESTEPDTDGNGAGGSPMGGEVTVVPGVARYHRRGCILIRFLSDGDLETMTRREAEAGGSVPCKACQPDKPDPSD